jgi:hypothetical protein
MLVLSYCVTYICYSLVLLLRMKKHIPCCSPTLFGTLRPRPNHENYTARTQDAD